MFLPIGGLPTDEARSATTVSGRRALRCGRVHRYGAVGRRDLPRVVDALLSYPDLPVSG